MGEYVIGKVGLFQDQLNVLIQEHTWQNHGLLNVPLTLYHSILCVSDNVIYLYNVMGHSTEWVTFACCNSSKINFIFDLFQH